MPPGAASKGDEDMISVTRPPPSGSRVDRIGLQETPLGKARNLATSDNQVIGDPDVHQR